LFSGEYTTITKKEIILSEFFFLYQEVRHEGGVRMRLKAQFQNYESLRHAHQASKRAARPDGPARTGLAQPGPTRLLSRAGRAGPQKSLGRVGHVFCRAGPVRRFYGFFYFLSNFIPVISDRNY